MLENLRVRGISRNTSRCTQLVKEGVVQANVFYGDLPIDEADVEAILL